MKKTVHKINLYTIPRTQVVNAAKVEHKDAWEGLVLDRKRNSSF